LTDPAPSETLAVMSRFAPAIVFLAWSVAACGSSPGSERAGAPAFVGFTPPSATGPDSIAAAPGGSATTPGVAAPNSPAGGESGSGEAPNAGLPLGTPPATPGSGAGSVTGDVTGSVPGDVTGDVTGSDAEGSGVPASPLPRSTPEAEGLSSAGLLALVSALDGGAGEVHSLMLLRHGKVVAEGWWAPYSAEDIHVLYSVSKSFNSTAVGLAVEQGLISVDAPIASYFPDLAPPNIDPEMATMRVRDLLTMSTGHEVDSIDAMRQRTDGQWTRSFLESNVPRAPGSYFLYNSGAAYMLGSLVQRVTGMTVDEYLRPRLFEPLGISGEVWGQSAEGVNLTDGGLSVRTEDLAKFGLLYLQGGMWNGARVLSAEWAADATAKQVSNGNDDSNWGYGYGYQFWRSQVGYRADGSLGQFSFVLPEQDIVLAITSGTNDTGGVMDRVWDNLLPAILGAAQPENPTALAALRDRLAGLALPKPGGATTSPRAADVSGRRYATPQNSLGMTGLTFDFAGPSPVLSIEDADGTHAITVGLGGSWVRQRTGYRKHINDLFDTPEQGLAATGAWSADDTFVARLTFDETPYTMTTTFRFQGEQVRVNTAYNVRWGTPSEPEVIGAR
jgi:CubicO group peptidase (beta-lactamase class C family)